MSWYATEERTGVLLVTVWTVAPLRASLKDGVVPATSGTLKEVSPAGASMVLTLLPWVMVRRPGVFSTATSSTSFFAASPFGMYIGVGLPLRPMGVIEYGAFVGCERWLQYKASWVIAGLTPFLNQEM